jgi:hypothetical protein
MVVIPTPNRDIGRHAIAKLSGRRVDTDKQPPYKDDRPNRCRYGKPKESILRHFAAV